MPLVKRQPASTRTVRRWTEETYETLQGCFEVTDWKERCEPYGDDIDECITDYISFCVEMTAPAQAVDCYPSNNPWVMKDLKDILNDKEGAFRADSREEMRTFDT